MQQKVYQMHIAISEYRRVETWASSGVGRAGPPTYRCSYQTAAMPYQCVWHLCENSKGNNIRIQFTCSSLVCLL